MPLIDYKCEKCGSSFFEVVNGDNEKVVCPKCGSTDVKREYKGKYYGKGGSCSGSCGSCSGCGH